VGSRRRIARAGRPDPGPPAPGGSHATALCLPGLPSGTPPRPTVIRSPSPDLRRRQVPDHRHLGFHALACRAGAARRHPGSQWARPGGLHLGRPIGPPRTCAAARAGHRLRAAHRRRLNCAPVLLSGRGGWGATCRFRLAGRLEVAGRWAVIGRWVAGTPALARAGVPEAADRLGLAVRIPTAGRTRAAGRTRVATRFRTVARIQTAGRIQAATRFQAVARIQTAGRIRAAGRIQAARFRTASRIRAAGRIQAARIQMAGRTRAAGRTQAARFRTASRIRAAWCIRASRIQMAGRIQASRFQAAGCTRAAGCIQAATRFQMTARIQATGRAGGRTRVAPRLRGASRLQGGLRLSAAPAACVVTIAPANCPAAGRCPHHPDGPCGERTVPVGEAMAGPVDPGRARPPTAHRASRHFRR
jgi:hypothetical protein